MLDSETKRRIDSARDILVGKVPDPKSQVEQITIALIYKFMDDMDAEAEELGGKREFFAGAFAKYGWAQLYRSGLGGQEMLNLYAEGISKLPTNPGVPALFRDIFKNAFLPYRDPETLRSFLKVIDQFTYDHSERLGDAFEYLLSVLGSQGDAGQFRTPRHIIDFVVAIVDPKKHETVLDPACGTAGFVISAFKHIARANTNAKGQPTLTPDDKRRLAKNLRGYDISPDMVRLSLVNLYLHGFNAPQVHEYDTLTSEERWNEYADVILANPPFMSPKGGIKPHKRFSIQAKRSEVLFVDYMAEHLTPNGRAGIIVPEGLIFQSQTAYGALRKMLVETCLVAVISLPAGCFNPYSGVKTSILILDKSLAKQAQTIAFFKVENDGFGLGAQRRPIEQNDLPQVQTELTAYLQALRSKTPIETLNFTTGLVVPKEKIAANGDYNLSGERYRVGNERTTIFPKVALGELLKLEFGTRITKKDNEGTLFPVYGGGGESFRTDSFTRENDVVISRFAMSPECVRVVQGKFYLLDSGFTFSIADGYSERATKGYVVQVLLNSQERIYACARGHAQKNIDVDTFKGLQIPLPPLEVQQEIVAEIEGYQKVISGARAVLDNYRPHIPIHPDWPMVPIGELVDSILLGLVRNKAEQDPEWAIPYIKMNNITADGALDMTDLVYVNATEDELSKYSLKEGDFIYNTRNAPDLVGKSAVFHGESGRYLFNNNILRIRFGSRALPDFVNTVMNSDLGKAKIRAQVDGTTSVAALYQKNYLAIEIPLPPLPTQQAIVAEIEEEQALVAANRELITRFEKKIQTTLTRIWGEEKAP
jgi:type I restriction enzyme M protein